MSPRLVIVASFKQKLNHYWGDMPLLRRILERFLSRSKGLDYSIDPCIATDDLLGLVARQLIPLARGILRRRALVFIESGVILRSQRLGEGTVLQKQFDPKTGAIKEQYGPTQVPFELTM